MACNAGPDIIEDGLVFCLDAANKRSYLGSGTAWDDLAGDFSGVMTNGLSLMVRWRCLLMIHQELQI